MKTGQRKFRSEKRKNGVKKVLAMALACSMVLSTQMLPVQGAEDSTEASKSLPTVKSYDVSESGSSFTANAETRIFYVSDQKPEGDIENILKLASSEMAAKIESPTALNIVYGPETGSTANDIVIKVGSVEKEGADLSQAYEMNITEEKVSQNVVENIIEEKVSENVIENISEEKISNNEEK